jgi:hypothetical protein
MSDPVTKVQRAFIPINKKGDLPAAVALARSVVPGEILCDEPTVTKRRRVMAADGQQPEGPAPRTTADHAVVSPAQKICGWCRKEIAPGSQPATYGICQRCFLQVELDAKRPRERRA